MTSSPFAIGDDTRLVTSEHLHARRQGPKISLGPLQVTAFKCSQYPILSRLYYLQYIRTAGVRYAMFFIAGLDSFRRSVLLGLAFAQFQVVRLQVLRVLVL